MLNHAICSFLQFPHAQFHSGCRVVEGLKRTECVATVYLCYMDTTNMTRYGRAGIFSFPPGRGHGGVGFNGRLWKPSIYVHRLGMRRWSAQICAIALFSVTHRFGSIHRKLNS